MIPTVSKFTVSGIVSAWWRYNGMPEFFRCPATARLVRAALRDEEAEGGEDEEELAAGT